MIDVRIPTGDRRARTLTRYTTSPSPELLLLFERLKLVLPAQPPAEKYRRAACHRYVPVAQIDGGTISKNQRISPRSNTLEPAKRG
jgi:hypothetical protein